MIYYSTKEYKKHKILIVGTGPASISSFDFRKEKK